MAHKFGSLYLLYLMFFSELASQHLKSDPIPRKFDFAKSQSKNPFLRITTMVHLKIFSLVKISFVYHERVMNKYV